MTHINIDLTKVQDPFAPIPENNYSLQCVDAEMTTSQKGDEMAVFQWEVIGDEEHSGRRIFDRCMLGGKGAQFGLWRLRQVFESCGLDLSNPDPTLVIGKQIRAFVNIEVSTDPAYGDQNRIAKIL